MSFPHVIRNVISILLMLSLWMGSAAALSPDPDHITLTWTGDPRTTQTVTWRTDAATTSGSVRVFETVKNNSPPQDHVMAADTRMLVTPSENMNLHTVTLTGLKAGTRYNYQVGGPEKWSPVYSFNTESQQVKEFKILIFGDSQSTDYGVWRATLNQAFQSNQDAAFFTNVGDLVDVGQDYAQWEAWFAAVQGVAENLPTMPLTGNHESYTLERTFSRPEFFTAQFMLPNNGPEGLKGQAYSFDYGNVHFIMLDSQEGEQRQFLPDLLERQQLWLQADLAATQKKWKVAFLHRPIYGNKPNGVNDRLRQSFAPIFDQYQVDLVFTAHDHVVARTEPLYNNEVMPQGTIYATTGRSGTKTYSNVSASEWNVFFYNPVEEPTYIVVNVNRQKLQVRTVGQSGRIIDEWAIEKQKSVVE